MESTITRSRWLTMLLVMLTTATWVVTGPAAPADAYCDGVNDPQPIFSNQASELASSGTCDGLDDYYGQISDRLTDGACAVAEYVDAGQVSTQGIDCSNNGTPVNYTFFDRNGDSSAYIRVCGTTCSPWVRTYGF